MRQILEIKSLLIDKSNEERVYEILDPLFNRDIFYITDGADEQKTLMDAAKKQLDEIGEYKIREQYVDRFYDEE